MEDSRPEISLALSSPAFETAGIVVENKRSYPARVRPSDSIIPPDSPKAVIALDVPLWVSCKIEVRGTFERYAVIHFGAMRFAYGGLTPDSLSTPQSRLTAPSSSTVGHPTCS
ncbi:MAG TPA: hypothetical protein VJ734_05105 [Nitrosospira sp.]|nr:hypothetical protein [Nitrosospira sp.]